MRQYDSIRQKISRGRCWDFVEVGKRRARACGGDARPLEPLIARTYGIPPSLPFSHYRFAERARRFGRSDRLAKHLHKVIDTSGGVPRLADAAVSNLECGAACPVLLND